MNNKSKENILITFAIIVLIAWVLIALFSCNTERRAQKKDEKAVQRLLARDKMDDYCADLFPVKDSLIKGDSVVIFDSLYLPGENTTDTLIEKDTVRITITKTLPSKTIIKTVYKTDTIIRQDNAALNALRDDNRKLVDLLAAETAESKKQKGRANKFLLWFLIAVGAGAMYIFLKFKKIIK